MLNKISRRTFVSFAAASVAMPSMAFALSDSVARGLVEKVVADINKIIASGKSEKAMLKDFRRVFKSYGDVPIMAQYALGVDGRSASARQKREFAKAFEVYISNKYGKRFREFIGGRIEVKSTRKISSGYEVKTTAYLKGEAPFEVTFLVSDKSGKSRFFNMFIEGVNLLLTERTEIGAILDRNGGNLDKTIQQLKNAS